MSNLSVQMTFGDLKDLTTSIRFIMERQEISKEQIAKVQVQLYRKFGIDIPKGAIKGEEDPFKKWDTQGKKLYSATEIGEMLGVSKSKIGIITSKNKLKIPKYGTDAYCHRPNGKYDTSFFLYYENVIPKIMELL